MAGMGPPPKDPSLRARRNKTSTSATLSLAPDVQTPELPPRHDEEGVERPWNDRTVEWWKTVWASPMAGEWLDADVPGLVLIAELWDEFYVTPGVTARLKIAGEIRLQEQRFGLSPMDRRRLQWEVERTEDAKDRGRKRRAGAGAAPKRDEEDEDPRAALAAV